MARRRENLPSARAPHAQHEVQQECDGHAGEVKCCQVTERRRVSLGGSRERCRSREQRGQLVTRGLHTALHRAGGGAHEEAGAPATGDARLDSTSWADAVSQSASQY